MSNIEPSFPTLIPRDAQGLIDFVAALGSSCATTLYGCDPYINRPQPIPIQSMIEAAECIERNDDGTMAVVYLRPGHFALASEAKAARFDAIGQLSEAQYSELLALRGGCRCTWPTASPPCSCCTTPLSFAEADELGWLDEEECTAFEAPHLSSFVLASDEPGIAAMAAKNVEPPPQPTVSVCGEQVSEREIAEALQLLRARQPQPVSTPRGLLVVAGFDHRLGRWNEGV